MMSRMLFVVVFAGGIVAGARADTNRDPRGADVGENAVKSRRFLRLRGAVRSMLSRKSRDDGRRLTASCEDNPSWSAAKPFQTCNWVASRTPQCNRAESGDGVKASEACPVTCGTCPACDGGCCDDASWNAGTSRNCAWIADRIVGKSNKRRNKICNKKRSADGVQAKKACRATCGSCDRFPACEGACCDSTSWKKNGKDSRDCDWVSADSQNRCDDFESGRGTPTASEACLVACGKCVTFPPTDEPTPNPTPKPSSKPTFRLPSTTAEKTECLAAMGDWTGLAEDFCRTCCPTCTAVDTDSFKSHFVYNADYYVISWEPNAGVSCVCLDLASNNYGGVYGPTDKGKITLTSSSDCARVTGNRNYVIGDPNRWGSPYGPQDDDAMVVNGDTNFLKGLGGNDHLAEFGSGNSGNYLFP